MSKNDKYWCAFSRLTKVSSSFVSALYNHFGSIEFAWNASMSDLLGVPDITFRQVNDFLEERAKINPDQTIEYIRKRNIDFIHQEDVRYPYLLRFINNSPIGIFVKGDLSSCNLKKTLGVVGSRKASENAKVCVSKILSGFKGTDVCIVSGLAQGIDTAAHKSAINNNLKTIAVIGGGFDKLYPRSNEQLFRDIIEGNGAVITEYWVDSDALSWHFPHRNRIISGLSKGVLVAEAALKSGAMITAKLAIEHGRELMCMPGIITNPNTEGIYKLIKDGASIVTNAQDVMDTMNWVINSNNVVDTVNKNKFSEDEKQILDVVGKDALSFDEIIMKTDLNINDLMVILTKLELDGVITQTNGKKFILVE